MAQVRSSTALERPWKRWKLPAAWLLALILYSVAIYGGFARGSVAIWITDGAWTLSSLLAALWSFAAAWRATGRLRIGWALLTGACCSWWIGQLLWDWNEIVRGQLLPFPELSDFFFTSFGVFTITAMFALREPRHGRRLTTRSTGNLGLIVCSFATVFVTAVLEPGLHSAASAQFIAVALIEAAVISVAFICSFYFLWSYRWGALGTPLVLLVAGIAVHAAAAIVYIHRLMVDEYSATDYLNVAWLAAFGLHSWAASEFLRDRRGSAHTHAAKVHAAERWIEALLPGFLLLVVVITGFAFHSQLSSKVLAIDGVLLALFALLLAARESWVYLREKTLQSRLSTTSSELERARARLRRTREELRESEESLRVTAAAGNVGLWQWDVRHNQVLYNEQWKRQLGHNDEEIGNDLAEWRERLHPEDQERVLVTTQKYLQQPWDDFEVEFRLRHKDGMYRWILSQATVVHDSEGQPKYMSGSHLDITRHKQLEQALRDSETRYRELAEDLELRVQERAGQLQDAYRELESFAYAVSHDLKAPLRAIDGFSHLLVESSKDKLTPIEQGYVDRVRHGALQMAALIDGLLAYSRIERRELRSASVGVREVIGELLAERQEEMSARGITLTCDVPAVTLHVDREGLAIIMRNLLGNAIKFTRHVAHPRIEIAGTLSTGKLEVSVKDNGVGFDQTYHDQIFRIFQRLHRVDEYEGTGVGLALARKAAQRMRGQLWAESAQCKGATFYLELPLE
jgi:PAS domain S-box-containing protein